MIKKMVFVFRVGVFRFYFFYMDDLTLDDMALILNVDINVSLYIETRNI
jgi:hypothetical protein